MKSVPTRSFRILAGAAILIGCASAVALAATQVREPARASVAGTDMPFPDRPAASKTMAELEFPDAPYGVDPMVTGPRSASLQARQDLAGCADAVWPNIPVACYPD